MSEEPSIDARILRGCDGKIKHVSLRQASAAVDRLRCRNILMGLSSREWDAMLQPYECIVCGRWHIGHQASKDTRESLMPAHEHKREPDPPPAKRKRGRERWQRCLANKPGRRWKG